MCEHLDDMEHLLLDDDNVDNSCLKCRKNNLSNGHVEDHLSSGKLIIEDPIYYESMPDNTEDSPLLINVNECFREHFGDAEFHCHSSLSSVEDSKALKKLLLASGFCFLFMLAELVGGYLADSLAIMTDAAHLFSDFVGFMISVMAIVMSKKSSTKHMTFGYYRAEVVGAFLSVLTIWFLAAVFLVLALRRLYREEYNIDANAMIVVASIGLVVNVIMGGILHGVCHTHSHGLTNNGDNINVRAAAAHVLGDLLQSVGVFLAAVIIKIFPDAQAADPICTFIFSVIIIFTTAQVGKDSIWLLMQGSPVTRENVSLELRKIGGVRHVHDVNIWSLAPGINVVTAHLAVDEYCDKDVIIQNATSSIKAQLPIFSCTIQVETFNMEGVNNCKQCKLREC
ncbi:proton-coupled zinc antiporter SLC30A2-like [Euwallacea similis]|uniref:proton-coupled zinc antiporter SLC30A2-like n=1 Tax=Euwallacea similis TaxID=1736056 RepID=UPI00344F964B